MIVFQLITLPFIALLAIRSALQLLRSSRSRPMAAVSLLIWLIAFAAILRPDLTTLIASFLGIGRGADLILYLLCVAFLLAAFYLYNRFQKLDSHITDLVRQLAIKEALERWPAQSPGGQPRS